ncbi:hypothetical protein [Nocardia nova]|uniref:hypothetical protein n=1 Tax=Nocardia nova TaxID=37330 RepID=UPI0011DCA02E|nr:hypothetical protein [Nocardia nova]
MNTNPIIIPNRVIDSGGRSIPSGTADDRWQDSIEGVRQTTEPSDDPASWATPGATAQIEERQQISAISFGRERS